MSRVDAKERNKPKLTLEEYKVKTDAEDYGLADDLWDFDKFQENLQMVRVKREDMMLEFDIIGLPVTVANAIRRIMLSEVPSMAIEKVYIYNNTTIIQDEVLAHRLGLIPLKADPRFFEYKIDQNEEGTDNDTLEFELKFRCGKKEKDGPSYEKNYSCYSGQIKWLPKGRQGTMYKEKDIGPIESDILLAKMRPGHELDLKLLAVKGIGKDHAKFSPVATAWYRLLPEVTLNREVVGRDAYLLQKCFSPGVIEVDKDEKAVVKDARYDSCSRNVYRYPQLADAVTMSRVRDHFIFTIESVGAMEPEDIFIEAVKVLKKKCLTILEEIK